MATPIAAGVLVGKALDDRYGTGSFWTLTLLGAGVTVAILEAAIALQRAQRTTYDV